jgi:hypothetical protein
MSWFTANGMTMKQTLIELNCKRMMTISHHVHEDSVLVSIFRQEYPDIPEIETAYWLMVHAGDLLHTILLKMEQKAKDDETDQAL